MIKFDKGTVCTTGGNGVWSQRSRAVELLGMDLAYLSEDSEFGELRVYFDAGTWNVDADGLIYSDEGFEAEFKRLLMSRYGFGSDEAAAVYYSEQGMQGRRFVSFDCDTAFIKEFKRQEAVAALDL